MYSEDELCRLRDLIVSNLERAREISGGDEDQLNGTMMQIPQVDRSSSFMSVLRFLLILMGASPPIYARIFGGNLPTSGNFLLTSSWQKKAFTGTPAGRVAASALGCQHNQALRLQCGDGAPPVFLQISLLPTAAIG